MAGANVNELSQQGWQSAVLSNPGANLTAWSYTIPNGLEGQYILDVYTEDTVNNVSPADTVWRGVIDTLAPRGNISAQFLAGGSAATTEYSFSFEDMALDPNQLTHPCKGHDVILTQSTEPVTRTTQLRATCEVPGHQTGVTNITACDVGEQCTTKSVTLTFAVDLPGIAILTPLNRQAITVGVPISITGAVFDPAIVNNVRLFVNGQRIQDFSPIAVDAGWQTSWQPLSTSIYTITAIMTNSLNYRL